MLRNIRRKHGLIYLVCLLIFGFIFVSKCLESSDKIKRQENRTITLSINQIENSLTNESVINRRAAVILIKKRKLKKFIPNLLKIILSDKYTIEDRKLCALTIGAICNLNTIKKVLLLLKNENYTLFYLPLLEVISQFLDYNNTNVVTSLKNFNTILYILLNNDTPSVKKIILDIITKSKYHKAFNYVFRQLRDYRIKPQAVITLVKITKPRQKPYIIHKLNEILKEENNIITRRYIKRGLLLLEHPDLEVDTKLINLFSDLGTKSITIRQIAFKKLLKLKKSVLLPIVKIMISDREKRVKLMTAKIVGYKEMQGFEDDLNKLISGMLHFHKGYKDYNLAMDCIKASVWSLSKLHTKKAFMYLKNYVYDMRFKYEIYKAISNYTNDDAIKLLKQNIFREPETYMSLLAEILFQNKQFDFFYNNLKTHNIYLRMLAIKYTSKINNDKAKEALKKAMESEYNIKWKNLYKQAIDNTI